MTAASLTVRLRKLDKLYRSYRKKRRGPTATEFALSTELRHSIRNIQFSESLMTQKLTSNDLTDNFRTTETAAVDEALNLVQQYLASTSVRVTSQNITKTPEPSAPFFALVTHRSF